MVEDSRRGRRDAAPDHSSEARRRDTIGQLMAPRLRYRGAVYRIENACWRGPDGHIVHLLTWVTDDLLARETPDSPPGELEGEALDRWLAQKVAETLGAELG